MFCRHYLSTKKKHSDFVCGPSFLGLFLWEVPTTEPFWTAQNDCWEGLPSTIFQNHQPIRRTSGISRVLVSVTATLMMGNFPWRIERFLQIWDQFYLVERERARKRDFSSSRLTSLLELTSRLKLLWIYGHVISPVDPKWKYKDWKCWLRGQY